MIIKKVTRTPPSKLFHYTDLDSTVGILTLREFWLSNLYFQNDKNEFKIGLDIIQKHLELKKNEEKANYKNTIFLNSLDSALDSLVKQHVYTLSLSEESDLLSQWRGYANNCKGTRIELTNIEKAKKSKQNFLLPCIYEKNEQEEYISHLFHLALKLFNDTEEKGITKKTNFSDEEKPYSDAIEKAGSYFISTTNVACSIIKDNAFKEEREWRLLSFNQQNKIHFRTKSHFVVPYIKMNIPDLNNYLTDLMICVSPEHEISEKSLRFLLDNNNFENTALSKSKIPFRI